MSQTPVLEGRIALYEHCVPRMCERTRAAYAVKALRKARQLVPNPFWQLEARPLCCCTRKKRNKKYLRCFKTPLPAFSHNVIALEISFQAIVSIYSQHSQQTPARRALARNRTLSICVRVFLGVRYCPRPFRTTYQKAPPMHTAVKNLRSEPNR